MSIPTDIQKQLIRNHKSKDLPPRLYGLLKIHKDDIPLWPSLLLLDHLTLQVGNTSTSTKDSTHFVFEILKGLHLNINHRLVSFDVMSLFTRIPVNIIWNNKFYEQTKGLTLGSPLSLVIANFFIVKFEQKAIEISKHKPSVWYCCVDVTSVISF